MKLVYGVWEVGYDKERLIALYRDLAVAEAMADKERREAGDNGWQYVTSIEELR